MKGVIILLVSLFAFLACADIPSDFRPVAVPLITIDPLVQAWSLVNELPADWARTWYLAPRGLAGYIRIDGKSFRFLGYGPEALPIKQQGYAKVMPTTTTYTFESSGVQLKVHFTAPFLADEVDVLSRPVNYITYEVQSTDAQEHSVSVYFDTSAEVAVNDPAQEVVWKRASTANMTILQMGTESQGYFDVSGDNVGIDWGYVYIAAPTESGFSSVMSGADEARASFVTTGKLPTKDDMNMPRPCKSDWPVLAFQWSFNVPPKGTVSRHMLFGYDDIESILYFGQSLMPYWRRNGATAVQMLTDANNDYKRLMTKCAEFDQHLVANMTKVADEYYAAVGALAYRQALGAMKLTWHPKLNTSWYFLKEISSDGDLSTVDVIYPAAPVLLLFNPELLVRQLLPLLAYANNETNIAYNLAWAPHHLGIYPIGDLTPEKQEQMPIEETGNMLLLLTAAVQKDSRLLDMFAPKYWPLLQSWADYLVDNLPDPGNQLCTDDFEGPSPHNANLAAKGILGIAAFAELCEDMGKSDLGKHYASIAEKYAADWCKLANAETHSLLQYYSFNTTWSLKYNWLFDPLLKLNVFPQQVVQRDLDYYMKQMTHFSVPLDSRSDITKLDWVSWVAAFAGREQRVQLLKGLYNFANESPNRWPLSDLYHTETGKMYLTFRARPVVGGVFAVLLVNG